MKIKVTQKHIRDFRKRGHRSPIEFAVQEKFPKEQVTDTFYHLYVGEKFMRLPLGFQESVHIGYDLDGWVQNTLDLRLKNGEKKS